MTHKQRKKRVQAIQAKQARQRTYNLANPDEHASHKKDHRLNREIRLKQVAKRQGVLKRKKIAWKKRKFKETKLFKYLEGLSIKAREKLWKEVMEDGERLKNSKA